MHLKARLFPFLVAVSSCVSSYGQANIDFSGAFGSQLSLTLMQSVTYIATTTVAGPSAPVFVFALTGNLGSAIRTLTGNITFSINGGAPQVLNRLSSNSFSGDLNPADVYVFGGLPGINLGDTITLNAGTLTTADMLAAAPPSSGSFTTFISNSSGSRISSFGLAGSSAVPESGGVPLTTVAGLTWLGFLVIRRRVLS